VRRVLRTRHAPAAVCQGRVQGYFNVWPAIKRTDYERMAKDEELSTASHRAGGGRPNARGDALVQWLEVESDTGVDARSPLRWDQIGTPTRVLPQHSLAAVASGHGGCRRPSERDVAVKASEAMGHVG